MLGRNGLLAASAILLGAIARGDDPGTRPPAVSELQNWVAQLNDDNYEVREESARRLAEAGPAAISHLVEGLTSDEPEVAWRCGAALEQIGLAGDDATVEKIVQKLDAACAKTGRQGLKSLATELHTRQKQFRRERAMALIRKHGGQISGSGFDGGMEAMMPDPFGPAIVFEGPIVDMAVAAPLPAADAEAELPRGEVFDWFAEIGRVIGRAVAPGGAAPKEELKPDEPTAAPAEAVTDADAAAKDAAEKAANAAEKTAEAVREAVKAAADAAEAIPEEGRKPPPVVEEKVAEAARVEAAEVMLDGIAIGEAVFAMDGGVASGQWAQLALDSNWRGGDDGLAVLKDLPELTQIDLNQTKLTDKALIHLAKLPKLQQLNLHRAGFSRDALLKFHGQRPGLVIYARGDAMMGIHGDLGSSPLVLTTVQEGSGAAQAGLQPGDIIHQIDGVKIRDFSDLTICVSAKEPDEKIMVEFEREGTKRTVQIALSRRTD
jgi:hypothetical protein